MERFIYSFPFLFNMTDGRQISREVLEHLRMQSIDLWKKGKNVNEICDITGIKKSAIYNCINTYKKSGILALKRRKAPGASPKLSVKEKNKLLVMIEKTADNYGFDNPLWDCKKIRQLIYEQFKKRIHISNIWRLLKRAGISAKKPQREAKEKDQEEVEEWIKKVWPKILKHSRRWQAIIYFQDESSIQLTAFLGKTWAKKGVTPKVKVTGKRGSICLTSAISPAGRMIFRAEKEKIKAPQHIEFLKQIQKRHPNRKIIVLEDQARPHIAKKTREFIESQKKKLAVYYLPSYSPELNPDEHVWAYLKAIKLKAHQAKSMKEFKPLVFSKMKSIQMTKNLVVSFFYGPLFQ
ncbi:MAG: IS630 family transposase [Candidatus Woesearchaeota archaeon]